MFISYARKDRVIVAQIAQLLEKQFLVWWDPDLVFGDAFSDAIFDTIRTSKVFVSVVSEDSVQSIWVRKEADAARASGRPIIPVLIDATPLPEHLAKHNALNLAGETIDERNPRVAQFVRDIAIQIQSQRGRPDVVETEVSQKAADLRNNSGCAGAVASLVFTVLVGWFLGDVVFKTEPTNQEVYEEKSERWINKHLQLCDRVHFATREASLANSIGYRTGHLYGGSISPAQTSFAREWCTAHVLATSTTVRRDGAQPVEVCVEHIARYMLAEGSNQWRGTVESILDVVARDTSEAYPNTPYCKVANNIGNEFGERTFGPAWKTADAEQRKKGHLNGGVDLLVASAQCMAAEPTDPVVHANATFIADARKAYANHPNLLGPDLEGKIVRLGIPNRWAPDDIVDRLVSRGCLGPPPAAIGEPTDKPVPPLALETGFDVDGQAFTYIPDQAGVEEAPLETLERLQATNVEARNALGVHNLYATDPALKAQGYRMIRSAADGGSLRAQANLGLLKMLGIGGAFAPTEGSLLISRAIRSGLSPAEATWLWREATAGMRVSNFQLVFKSLTLRAQANDVIAQAYRGVFLAAGMSAPPCAPACLTEAETVARSLESAGETQWSQVVRRAIAANDPAPRMTMIPAVRSAESRAREATQRIRATERWRAPRIPRWLKRVARK